MVSFRLIIELAESYICVVNKKLSIPVRQFSMSLPMRSAIAARPSRRDQTASRTLAADVSPLIAELEAETPGNKAIVWSKIRVLESKYHMIKTKSAR